MQKELYHKSLFYEANKSSGTHRMNGIFIIKGNCIKAGQIVKNANIIDMAPTILYYLGLSVPEDMDGKVISEAFEKEYIEAHPASSCSSDNFSVEGGEGVLNEEETEKVREALRDLGYFG